MYIIPVIRINRHRQQHYPHHHMKNFLLFIEIIDIKFIYQNFQFCVGKILAFLNMFAQITQTWLEEKERSQ